MRYAGRQRLGRGAPIAAAVCAAAGGTLICRKRAQNGVTVALAKQDFRACFE